MVVEAVITKMIMVVGVVILLRTRCSGDDGDRGGECYIVMLSEKMMVVVGLRRRRGEVEEESDVQIRMTSVPIVFK